MSSSVYLTVSILRNVMKRVEQFSTGYLTALKQLVCYYDSSFDNQT